MDSALCNEWFRFAQMDFYTDLHLMETAHPKPLEIVCYHCQQAAEKWLKGILAYYEQPIPRIHALDVLNEQLVQLDDDYIKIRDACNDLTDYGVAVRYPAAIIIGEDDAQTAIENAGAIKRVLIEKGLLESL